MKTTAWEDHNLGCLIRQCRFATLGQVTAEFNLHHAAPVSLTTVRRQLHGQGVYSHIAAQKPIISSVNRQHWVTWCTRTLPWTVDENWKMLIFSDESRFSLAFNDGRVRVWRTPGERFYPECLSQIVRNSATSVMVWGCIGYYGVGQLAVLPARVNAQSYIETLMKTYMIQWKIYLAAMRNISYSSRIMPQSTLLG